MNLIFDFDGTIVNSIEIIISIINSELKKEPPYTVEKFRHDGIKSLITENHLSDVQVSRLIMKVRKGVVEKLFNMKLIEGMERAIKILSAKDKLFIITRNSSNSVKKYLENKNLLNYFEKVTDTKEFEGKKEEIEMIITE